MNKRPPDEGGLLFVDRFSPFNSHIRDALDKLLLSDQKERDYRQCDEDGSGHQQMPLDSLLILRKDGQPERHRQHLHFGRRDQRPKEIIPVPHRREQPEAGDGRARQRDVDMPEREQMPRRIKPCKMLPGLLSSRHLIMLPV